MNEDKPEMNEAVKKTLHSYRGKGRLLAALALGVGLLSIAVGVLVAVANLNLVVPMEGQLLRDHPELMRPGATNLIAAVESNPALRQEQDRQHLLVTFAHGKELLLTAAAVILIGLGTFLTLLLVIFNRRVTLRQINTSLAQISEQIKELQDRDGSGPAGR